MEVIDMNTYFKFGPKLHYRDSLKSWENDLKYYSDLGNYQIAAGFDKIGPWIKIKYLWKDI